MPGFGEPPQCVPMLQRVMKRLAQAVLRQHRMHGTVVPGRKPGPKRNGSLLSRCAPFRALLAIGAATSVIPLRRALYRPVEAWWQRRCITRQRPWRRRGPSCISPPGVLIKVHRSRAPRQPWIEPGAERARPIGVTRTHHEESDHDDHRTHHVSPREYPRERTGSRQRDRARRRQPQCHVGFAPAVHIFEDA